MAWRTVETESGTERDQVTLGELMKISAINEGVSLIANIGVIGLIVFLGLEMQQNTAMMQ